MDIIDRVKELIANYLEEHNIELVDITYRREQSGMVLRLLVDTPSGIKVNECEELNNYLNEAFDKENLIDERYTLEVSSPGLDRPIKTDRDFERSMGKELNVKTYEAIDGKRAHEGTLVGMDKENVVLQACGISTVIPRSRIAVARRKVEL